jgi:DNA-binding phage protein
VIRQRLKDTNSTTTVLAEDSGITRETISRIINGHSDDPALSTLRAIVTPLGLKLRDVIIDVDEKS